MSSFHASSNTATTAANEENTHITLVAYPLNVCTRTCTTVNVASQQEGSLKVGYGWTCTVSRARKYKGICSEQPKRLVVSTHGQLKDPISSFLAGKKGCSFSCWQKCCYSYLMHTTTTDLSTNTLYFLYIQVLRPIHPASDYFLRSVVTRS